MHTRYYLTHPVLIWLMLMILLLFAMLVVGGITRLTDSGLSMVEWRLLMGAIPPLTDGEWQRIFALYQQSPEGSLVNRGLSLAGFKWIFFWEYLHRLMGRLLGLVYIVPMLWFAWCRQLAVTTSTSTSTSTAIPAIYIVLLILGAAQGGIGWWMVQSGLVDAPQVAPYRLAVHLGLALLIFALLVWTLCDGLYGRAHRPRGLPALTLTCVAVTIVAGALLAGNHGGLIYNEYPLMGEGFLPIEYGFYGWADPFINPASAQFHHRWLAALTLLLVGRLAWRVRHTDYGDRGGVMLALVVTQFGLGILTLLFAVPFTLAILHQAVAALLLASVIWLCHGLCRD